MDRPCSVARAGMRELGLFPFVAPLVRTLAEDCFAGSLHATKTWRRAGPGQFALAPPEIEGWIDDGQSGTAACGPSLVAASLAETPVNTKLLESGEARSPVTSRRRPSRSRRGYAAAIPSAAR